MRPGTDHGFTLLELMVTVAIVGLLAAVAVPSFINYQKKAKTAEASTMLEKMYDGARIYYLDDSRRSRSARTVVTVPPQFPASNLMTPAGNCCGAGSGRCAPADGAWHEPTWQALAFSPSEPHYYRYQFVSSASSGSAPDQFFARAFGDLDCDGQLSTFEMYGEIDADGNISGRTAVASRKTLE